MPSEPIPIHKDQPDSALLERVQALMQQQRVSQAQLADEIGMSKGVVSEWLRGGYDHQSTIVPALTAWLSRQHGRFFDLRNSRRVLEACEYAVARRRMVLVVGPPGMGKTVALKEFHRQRIAAQDEIIYHYTSPVIRHHSLAKMIARRLQLGESGSAFDIVERIVNRLRRHPIPMVFDEANHLNVACLEILRYVWDSVHLPLILCGSMKLERTLSEASARQPEIEQLQSRMALRVLLEKMRADEIRRFVTAAFKEEELGEDTTGVLNEFRTWSRGIVRDLSNGIESCRELMSLNKTKTLTVELVRTAFSQRLLVA
jgi:DNA transposition AAA+ family ATPase